MIEDFKELLNTFNELGIRHMPKTGIWVEATFENALRRVPLNGLATTDLATVGG
jgi:hypothetical protein